jgi:hypothetical protein
VFTAMSDATSADRCGYPDAGSEGELILFIYGGILSRISREEMFRVRHALGLRVAPEFAVLSYLLPIFAVLMIVVAVTLSGIVLGCVHAA